MIKDVSSYTVGSQEIFHEMNGLRKKSWKMRIQPNFGGKLPF